MKTVIFPKLTKKEAEKNIKDLEEWFRNNPRRKVCHTDLFKVRRSHIREDVLSHTINS